MKPSEALVWEQGAFITIRNNENLVMWIVIFGCRCLLRY